MLEWAGDRVLARLGRSSIFAVHGEVDAPTVLLLGTLTNRAGRTVSMVSASVAFPFLDVEVARADVAVGRALTPTAVTTPHTSPAAMFTAVGVGPGQTNPGAPADLDLLSALIAPAVDAAHTQMKTVVDAATSDAEGRVSAWAARVDSWDDDAGRLLQNRQLRSQRRTVGQERELIAQHSPAHTLIRPLLVVVPRQTTEEGGR